MYVRFKIKILNLQISIKKRDEYDSQLKDYRDINEDEKAKFVNVCLVIYQYMTN